MTTVVWKMAVSSEPVQPRVEREGWGGRQSNEAGTYARLTA